MTAWGRWAVFILAMVGQGAMAAAAVKIAFIGGFTGSDPNTANELWRGLTLAVAQGPAGAVELLKLDDKGQVDETVRLTREAVAQGAKIITGLPTSDEALAAAKVVAGQDVILIAPFATNPTVSQQGANILQLCFSDNFQGEVLARFALRELHSQRVLVVTNVESIYSTGLSGSFKHTLESTRPGVVLKELVYTKQDLKLDELVGAVQTFHPDVIFVPDHIIRASVLIKKAYEANPKIRFLGGDGLGGRRVFLEVFGSLKDIELYYTGHWHERLDYPANREFVKQYQAMFSPSPPSSGAAISWDGGRMILRGITKMPMAWSTPAWLKFLRENQFQTTMGVLNLKSEREPPRRPAVLIGLKQGQYEYLRQVR